MLLVFGVVGLVLLQHSRAATFVVALEAESGTGSGNMQAGTDANASNGKYVKFSGGSSTTTGGSFRFAAFSDTKTGTDKLQAISDQVVPMNPAFVIYPGDVCESGPDDSCFGDWKSALNGGGDLYSKSFVTRGNHDAAGSSFWTQTFDFAGVASSIGAKNYGSESDNMTYSFDYGNSHFVALDMPGGDATTITSSQLDWLDADLTSAEGRGIVHSFLFFHGPPVPEGGHCCTNGTDIIDVLSKHTSVAATFNGHEHNTGYELVDSRDDNTGHVFREFVVGGAGAELYDCERGDFCSATNGFAMVDVNGQSVTVGLYKTGSSAPIKTVTFN
jgi:hypothetical protein